MASSSDVSTPVVTKPWAGFFTCVNSTHVQEIRDPFFIAFESQFSAVLSLHSRGGGC
jgi:hypothetical protein